MLTGETAAIRYLESQHLLQAGPHRIHTFSLWLCAASGVRGDITVLSELSVSDCCPEGSSSNFLKPDGAWITEAGPSSEPVRVSLDNCVSSVCIRPCSHQSNAGVLAHFSEPTLPGLSGLVISISGDCTSSFVVELGDFTPSSCSSSSISVLSVPLESTGDGSVPVCGYGLGGGASESEGPDDLR